MTVVALRRIAFLGLSREKRSVLEGLQALGCVHLEGWQAFRDEAVMTSSAYQAFRYLHACPQQRRYLREAEDFDLDAVTAEALDLRDRIRALEDERDLLDRRIRIAEPWGEFDFPGLDELGGQRLWFYVVPLYRLRSLAPPLPWEVVHQDNRNAYVCLVAPREPPPEAMPAPRVHLGGRSLVRLLERREAIEVDLEDLQARRAALTRWLYLMGRSLARAEDRAALGRAEALTRDQDPVFAVEGWAPAELLGRLEQFAAERGLALLAEAPGPADRPPTLLRNPEALAGGQELLAFYSTPGYRAPDPSVPLFFSFTLFFAMILSDAGYALILGAVLALVWQRLGRNRRGRRLRRLSLAVVGTSLGYGVLAGTYFGAPPEAGGWLENLQLLQPADQRAMMTLAVAIGVAHVALANLLQAWSLGPIPRALAPLGWTAVVIGGFLAGLAWTGVLPVAGAGGALLAGLGALAVLLCSSERPWPPRDLTQAGLRLVDGMLALSGLTRAFGDVMSYLRLFALGLATSSLALTFNQLATDAMERLPGTGVLVALLILLAGHGLNLVLALMSGVVHGLRLNFIEYFNWGVPEEGYPFRRFARREAMQWIRSSSR